MDWKKTSRLLSLTAAGIGAMVFAGWILEIDALKRVHPALVTMKANTAACLILAGIAIAVLTDDSVRGVQRHLAKAFALLIAIVAGITFGEHLGLWDPGIDQWLFRESVESAGQSFPGRMGPASAVVFMLIAAAILMLDRPATDRTWPTQICAAAAMGMTFLIFLAYFYGVEALRPLALYTSIALHTVVAFLLLCWAILLARPDRGIVQVILANDIGGMLARRLLPVAVLLPPSIGWLLILGEKARLFGPGVKTALFATTLTCVFTTGVWLASRVLTRAAAARDRLAAIVDSSGDAIVSKSLDGIVTSWNAGAERLFGYSAAEMIGKPVKTIIPAERLEEEMGILQRLRAGQPVQLLETMRMARDGRVIAVSLSISPVRDERGVVTGASTIARDISARRIAEAALSEQRRWFRVTLSSIGDAVIATDAGARIIFINPMAEKLTGWTADEAVGRPLDRIFKIVDEATRHAVENPVTSVLHDGVSLRSAGHTALLARGDAEISIDYRAAPIRDAEGKATGVVMVFHDVTERRRAEAKLRASETLKGAILSTSLDGFILMDHEGRIRDWNAAATQIFGKTRDEAVGRILADTIVPERLRAAHLRGLTRFVASRERGNLSKRYVLPGLRADGSEFPCEISISSIPGTVPPVFAGYLRDITERQRAESALEEARRQADAASRAKDEFLAALSHELRTPLTPVLMLSAAMEQSQELPEDVRKDFGLIRKNVELEARIIDDLLDLTRITRGRMALQFTPVDPHPLIDDTLGILRAEINAKRINVVCGVKSGEHWVRADAVRLQQVFWNIIKNAVKFTPDGGAITIETGSSGSEWTLTVRDTGLGITAEEMPRIFDAWSQGDAAAEPRFGGLGLGLSISMHVVRLHEGRLWAESPGRGHGAAFHVALPLTAAPSPSVAPDGDAVRVTAKPLRILLVEDHQATRETLARLLTNRGHTVKSARSAADARALADGDAFDLLISDLGLPDGNGRDVMQALRQSGARGIALSGFGMESDVLQSSAAGFDAHLIKPVAIASLEAVIRRVMAVSRDEASGNKGAGATS